jgi:ethanolaminephosphotransferase
LTTNTNFNVEGLIIACIIMVLSGYYGPAIWSTPLVKFFPSYEEYLEDIAFRDLWVPIIIVAFFIAHLPACVINVARARRAQRLPIAPLFLEWIPAIAFTFGCIAWLGSPYSYILEDNHLVLFCLTMSLVCGRMTTKIILAHLTRQPFPYWTVMLAPLIGGAVLVNHPYFTIPGTSFGPISARMELLYLRAYLVFAAVVYFRWAHLVITSICDFLGINCLTIPTPKTQSRVANGPKSPSVANGHSFEKGRRD